MPTADIKSIAEGLSEDARLLVVDVLQRYHDDFGFRHYRGLSESSGLPVASVKVAMRRLNEAGCIVCERGLLTEEGKAYGSGFALSDLGAELRQYLEQQL